MRYICLIYSLLGVHILLAQPDTIFRIPMTEMTNTERIVEDRQLLRAAFLSIDDSTVNALLDTLNLVLEDSFLAATYPEERWLLWYWTGNYPSLFNDLQRYDQRYRFLQSQKIQPPDDSLMSLLDEVSGASAHLLYQKIAAARMSAEETAFATLHLDYLLTPTPTAAQIAEQDDHSVAFLEKFPRSRFRYYVREFLYSGTKTVNRGNDFDLMFVVGRPDGRYGSYFKTSFGGTLGFAWWRNKFQLGGRLGVGFQTTRLDFTLDRTDVAADSLVISGFMGPEAGFILLNNGRIRLTPIAGAGMALLSIPARREADFARRFSYFNVYANIGINFDYRFGQPERDDEWTAGGTGQGGVRVSVGYQWLGFGNNDGGLRGNMLYVGVGYTFMTRQAYRLPYN